MKINRAIYYQLKTFTDGQIVKDKLKLSKIKKDLKQKNENEVGKDVGKGLSDDYDVDMLKNVNYNELKEIMENWWKLMNFDEIWWVGIIFISWHFLFFYKLAA